jgi:hypothetical protein
MRIETKAKLMYLAETKALIKNALNEKGIAISDSDTFRSYADSIRNTELKSDDVRYVTFMNGEATLYVKPVATGDDCVDVAAKGLIYTPKKESTVDKVFTYAGWAATDGGEVNANVLKAVTEDKTVYASYTDSPRYYTITYYDSDGTTVLKTESLAYGATTGYIPEKDGFSFNGWTPALATVSGDASYTAQWVEQLTFAGGSWADIARVCEAGEAADYFKVGDTRNIAMTNGENITVAIAGFDHDELADGSGKAGISVVCMSVPSATYAAFYGAEGTYDFYDETGLYYILNKSLINKLPVELSSVIKTVKKPCDGSYSSSNATINNYDFTLWTLSLMELGFETTTKYYVSLGSRYELFDSIVSNKTYAEKLPTVTIADTTTKTDYWLRQAKRAGMTNNCYATTSGGDGQAQISNNATTTKPIRFGFCI